MGVNMEFKFKIEDSLKTIVKLAVIQFDELNIIKRNDALVDEISDYCSELRATYQSTDAAMERLRITRSLYKSLGLDPTKNRPSSEALLRRVLKGKSLYQINSIVDICNLSSLHFLLSLGLYDIDKINGQDIQLRTGKQGEGYAGIGKEYVNVAGRFTLVDNSGPFGNPSSDSDRTKITLKTTSVMFVVFVPADYDSFRLGEHLGFIEAKVKQYHDCKTVFRLLG